MLSRRFDRQIFALALPALGTLAADPLVSLVDTAWVGRLGPVPLGALGVCTALFSLGFIVFNFLAYATTPRVARALGVGNREGAGRAALESLTLAVILGLVAFLVFQLLAVPALRIMGAHGELFEPALGYLRVRLLAVPALLLILASNGIYRGHQDMRTPFRVALVLNAINFILDPLFIFGFGWGLNGAAWATVIAQWVGAILFVRLLLFRDRGKTGLQSLRDFRMPALATLLPFLRAGWDLALRTFALLLALAVATAVATRVGVIEVAAHQVAVQLWLFMALIVDALAISAQSLVASYVGQGRPAAARAVADRLILLALLVGIALGIFFWLARYPLAGLFTDDAPVVAALLAIFPFVAAMQPLNSLVFIWDGIFIGLEDYRYLAGAMILASLVGIGCFLLVIPLDLGLSGIWWGMVILMLARIGTLAYRYWGTAIFRLKAREAREGA